MKKSLLFFLLTTLLFISGLSMAVAQEQPKPKKDTVNMDTDAKPTFYYAVEDDKTAPKGTKKGVPTIVIIAGVVVIVGATGFFLLKKKK